MKNIVYIGKFIMPDKNAAALRVINNSRMFFKLGFNVVFIGFDYIDHMQKRVIEIDNISYDLWLVPLADGTKNRFLEFLRYKMYLSICDKYESIEAIIVYNFPSIPFLKILKYAKSKNIKVISDVADWYETKGFNPISILNGIDTFVRMRILNKKVDGLILISKFLSDYYKSQTKVLIPPLVDISETKWNQNVIRGKSSKVIFIFAGNPTGNKENMKKLIQLFSIDSIYKLATLKIVGISKEELHKRIIKSKKDRMIFAQDLGNIVFMGKLNHVSTIREILGSDFSIIVRKNSRMNKAGFPTKLVESISCNVPCLCTKFSNIEDYIYNGVNGIVCDTRSIELSIQQILENRIEIRVQRHTFDYNNFISMLNEFMMEVR